MTGVDRTLGDLVTSCPQLAGVLDGFGLDFCCNGHQTLAEACSRAGQDLDRVVAAIEAAVAGPAVPVDWTQLDPAGLVEHIVATHHAYLRRELPQLLAFGRKVFAVHGERHPELGAVVATTARLWSALEPHLDDEEANLFPAVVAGQGADVAVAGRLADEHATVGALLDRLRDLTDGFDVPEDACSTYEAYYRGLAAVDSDTRLHVHKENNMLFPAVVAIESTSIADRQASLG